MKIFRLALALLLLATVPASAQSIFDYRIWGVSTSAAVKAPVVAATTGGITLSGAQTIDGVAVTDHLSDSTGLPPDRVLVKNQADLTTNGIYNVSASGAWTEASDFTGANNLVNGTIIIVARGSTNAGLWQLTSANPVVVAPDTSGASNITFVAYTATSASAILGSVCTTTGGIFDYSGSAYGCLAPPLSTPAFLMGTVGGLPSYVTSLSSLPGTGGTLTLPAGPDTLTGNAATDTFTNKTYDTAGTGNVFKINGTQISSISGNTSKVATASGTLTNTHCVSIDGSGNFVDAGGACTTGGGGGTVASGAHYQVTYYTGTGTTVGGAASMVTDANGVLDVAGSTITTNDPVLNLTQTWNASGTAFNGIFENITNTASAAGSLLENLEVGSSTVFGISKTGAITTGSWAATIIPISEGGAGVSLAATGGTSQVLKQVSSGANVTVAQLACSDLSNAAASCSTDATNASNISSGTVPTARLGSGSASSSTILYGNQTWGTLPSTGALTLLATVNASGVSSVSFGSSVLTNAYNKYVIEFDGFYTSANSDQLLMTLSTNNGSSYLSSGYSGYSIALGGAGAVSSFAATNSNTNFLFGGSSITTVNTSTATSQGTIRFSNPSASKNFAVDWNIVLNQGSGSLYTIIGGGLNTGTTAINNIKFSTVNGSNIFGNFHLLAIAGT
jgi:hypothetical protein